MMVSPRLRRTFDGSVLMPPILQAHIMRAVPKIAPHMRFQRATLLSAAIDGNDDGLFR